ncbi:ACS family hexuronate transporter-like MFS transporter [Catalinimonas alkaloidigena]|uniref:MFS transporter n=1 Tax=Catalinimonas alkaloidigena TaxID=1075417 RepID=UPI002405D35D|nr:MFS transporter [Catalinimonas alkaloidigena]MDF9799366.1 ACS family hexuronate transporter-like MFS transporter [Catalinimonas alkaloidigena]
MMKKSCLRWLVVSLVFIATGLSFLDRQVLSIAIIKIQDEFNITDVQYGIVNTSFLISYAIMFTLGGRLIDVVGARIGLGASVALWSVANTLHGFMTGFYQLVAFRFLLGMGEGGCFPGAARTVYEWFGEKERALANGIAIGGAAIGAVIAPPLTIWVANYFGWRGGFVIPGLVGLLWVVIWLMIPWKKRMAAEAIPERLTEPEKEEVLPFKTILKNKEAWIFILIRFMLDPVFYFFMFWIPKYLNEQRGLSFDSVGNIFWIPFLALGISNVMGGWLSDKLVARKMSVNKARKVVMGIAALLTIVAPFVEWVSTVEVAIALMALIMFAHGFWITNYITAISDIFGKQATSTVVGLSGTAGAVSGLLLNPLIGLIIQNYSYQPLWIASGLMYPLAFIIFILFVRQIRPMHTQMTAHSS